MDELPIELPPLPNFVGIRVANFLQDGQCIPTGEALQDYARKAVLADRQKRAQPERKVRERIVHLWGEGGGHNRLHSVTLKWDDNGAWLAIAKNERLANMLRQQLVPPSVLAEAADALDGGQ